MLAFLPNKTIQLQLYQQSSDKPAARVTHDVVITPRCVPRAEKRHGGVVQGGTAEIMLVLPEEAQRKLSVKRRGAKCICIVGMAAGMTVACLAVSD